MADSHLEKKHAATVRRRQQARQKGQVAVSGDLTSATLLLAAVASLWFFGGTIAAHLAGSMSQSLSNPTMTSLDVATATHLLVQIVGRIAIAIVPLLILMMLAGVLINLLQTGLIITPSRITPQLSNISPHAGIKRILSIRSLARFGFGIFKLIVIAAVAYAAVLQFGRPVMSLAALSIPQIAKTLFECLMGTCLWIGGALFTLALADYGFQRWKLERDLMMTDEELREELKETEGDPQMMNRRRDMARDMSMQRGGSPGETITITQSGGATATRKV